MIRYLAPILLAFSPCAWAATNVELGFGTAMAQERADGNWYQERFRHHLGLQSPAVTLGLRTDLSPRIALHNGVFWFGQNRSDADAVTHDDLYDKRSATGCPAACPRLARFTGHGNVWGFQSLVEFHTQGKWQVGLLAGPTVARTSWTETIPDWFPTFPDGSGGFTQGDVRPLHFKRAEWHISGAAGVRVTRGNVYAELMYYRNSGGASEETYFPAIWQSHTTFTLGMMF